VMRVLLGTLGGGGVFATLAAGGRTALVVAAIALVFYRLVRWVLDSDDRTRRAKELLYGDQPRQHPPDG